MSAVSTLGARVTALERQVAALRGRAGGGEQLSPNYLTSNPDGTIGANFTGQIHAQGLELDATAGPTIPANDAIRWLRTDTGGLVAQIQAYYSGPGGAASTALFAQSQGTTDLGVSLLEAFDDTGAAQALLKVCQINRGGMPNQPALGVNTEVDVAAGSLIKRLLGADGSSDFLQLVIAAQKLQLSLGTGTFIGNGTASVNPTTAINTQLASIVIAGAWPKPSPTWGGYLSCVGASPGSLTFAANTNGTFANGTTYSFYYIAIG